MKNLLGILPVILAVPSYFLYIKSVINRKTVPHMYSWLIWSVLAFIGYIAQINSGAGPGAWNTGITSIACLFIFILAIGYGERKLTRLDTALLAIAALATISRIITDSYTVATILASTAASIGFIFTIKKAYVNPNDENAQTFSINALRNLISLFALSSISFNTFFYPFCMMLANFAVALVVLYRKKKPALYNPAS
jgi:hypothetical protein